MTVKEKAEYMHRWHVVNWPRIRRRRNLARRRYYWAHKERHNAASERWRRENPEAYQRSIENWKQRLKLTVLSHYSKSGKAKCCWPKCPITDPDMLTLDHINDDGCKEKRFGMGFYRTLKTRGFPSGFQTLCANHQMKKALRPVARTLHSVRTKAWWANRRHRLAR